MKKCVFAGTFDPPTKGHTAIVNQAFALFDEVVVAILENPDKTPLFSVEERMEMLALCMPKGVKIRSFQGLLCDLLREENTDFYLRGLRSGTDYDYETENFYASKKLYPDIKAVYFPCEQDNLHISSSAVRLALKNGKPIGDFVGREVREYIFAKHGGEFNG